MDMRSTTTNPADPPEQEAPGAEPAEGRPDQGLPGADRPQPAPDRDDDLPQRLGERIEHGQKDGVASGEPDLLPNVEVPESTM
jgi:hypothetical protein